jgi:multidrug efflux pump subunit AcrB
MAISIALVVLVVFLFLRDAAATLIPSVTIPVSLLCTCAVMYLVGYTLDNVSLMALTIAVGFIIDDGIVMVENVIRHVEAGKAPTEAAPVGSREIGFTIVSMTLSLVAVFIPLLLMGGLVGRLFREFAVTVSVAILMSGVVSLTLTPMMCSRLLRPAGRRPDARVAAWLEAWFHRALGFYDDDGCAPRRTTAGARDGRGFRAPTAPGDRHRRRIVALPAAHPLHDAGRLHLHEQDRPTAPADRARVSTLRIG